MLHKIGVPMKRHFVRALLPCLLVPLAAYSQQAPEGPLALGEAGSYTFTLETEVPVSPERAYNLFTGDISPWWDHTFSENPKTLFIEAKPGGRFYEIFDETGDGALHATVIYAHRGRRLVLSGPLGFSGYAHNIVTAIDFEAAEGPVPRSRVKVTVHAAGEVEAGWAEAVRGVWHHFLIGRFKPYVEGLDKPQTPTP
jgi:uncharacterized protein YndB with AHSA1/START domain